ncbi:8757_t:CDS:2 [Cetraspora pellucida]|uniref:8757_t:CDS:1 n=1 Tax=Cetraspora pellucida TaxID=1433469 RepID=A0A9N9B5P2_9GLOM|nr:8757_t:CDS:2 [Cetraspora pellucida]
MQNGLSYLIKLLKPTIGAKKEGLQLLQKPGEKVNSYAAKFKRLLHKVEFSKKLSPAYVICMFLGSLSGKMATFITMMAPKMLNNAIMYTQKVEAVLESVNENLLLETNKFQKAQVTINFDKQKLVIRYLERRFEVPIMHTDKKKQKEYINKDMRSDSILVDKVSESKLERRIDNENVKEESLAVCLAVIKEVTTEKKVPVDEKLLIKDQLVRIMNSVNIEVQ